MDFSTFAVFCEHRYFENGHGMQWGRGPKHTFNGICRGFCAPSFSKLYFLRRRAFIVIFSSSVANGWNKSLSTLFFLHTTDMLGWTTVGWAGQRCVSSHGYKWSLCTMPTAYQFAAFQQLYSVLASSFLAFLRVNSERQCLQLMRKHIDLCTTKSAQRINTYVYINHKQHINSCTTKSAHLYHNTYVTACTWTRRKHINSCTTKSAQRINTYVTSCTWTRRKHINSYTTKSAQRINTYVTSWTISKHINSCTSKSAHLYQHVCHFMYMNQQETYQLMHHEKRTAYQPVCHFMYMNHK